MKARRFTSQILPVLGIAIAVFALRDGRSSETPRAEEPARVHVLLGTISRIDPPYVYMESDDLGHPAEFRILMSPILTYAIRLEEWAPGERERALAEYRRQVDALNPSSGDRIPPPPPVKKPVPIRLDDLKVGEAIGVRSDAYIKEGETVMAIAVRPLTADEVANDKVTVMFPY